MTLWDSVVVIHWCWRDSVGEGFANLWNRSFAGGQYRGQGTRIYGTGVFASISSIPIYVGGFNPSEKY